MKLFSLKSVVVALALTFGIGTFAAPASAGVNLSWSLLRTDKTNPSRRGCHEYLHKVRLKAGVTYVISMTSSKFDTYLFLETTGGTILARDDDSGTGLNARIIYTPSATGYYHIVATTYTPGAVGAYRLTITP